ncbi:MAG: UvrD-helicase domain-containing protein, partial [Thermoguttaceae bacterium]|nr:UvrD-helicase domain-containing protein [Thermoguttaceae bacterium]
MNYDIYDDSFDDPINRLLIGLNDAQRAAVTHKDGPLLVIAGPGSGKTRVVTYRIAWLLLNGVHDRQIAALTFTNKAADEMKQRLAILAPGNHVWLGTFHRFCAVLLRKYAKYVGLEENYVIYDAEQSKKLLEEIVPKSSLPKDVDVQKIASAISWAKNSLVSADDYCSKEGSALGKIVEDAYPAYQLALRKANAVDFDDLLFHVAVLLHEQPDIRASLDDRFRYVLVDEYQDTNFVQYAIARALSQDYPNLAVTGDPDQSIYGW